MFLGFEYIQLDFVIMGKRWFLVSWDMLNCLLWQQVKLDVNFQFFLKKEDLPTLHRNYDLYYETVIRTSAIDALKVCTASVMTSLTQVCD